MTLRRLLASLLVACGLPAAAADLTDLWGMPLELGWGVTTTQQGNVVFATIFTWGTDNKPLWYSSPASFESTDAQGVSYYRGPLYRSTGPAFTGAFTGTVANSNVGEYFMAVDSNNRTAVLSYTVSGVQTFKRIERVPFFLNGDLIGNYLGALVTSSYVCPFLQERPGRGPQLDSAFDIDGSPVHMHVRIDTPVQNNFQCSIDGPYTQDGRLGRIEGFLNCTNGRFGVGHLQDIESERTGVSARMILEWHDGCREEGRIAGVRRFGSQ